MDGCGGAVNSFYSSDEDVAWGPITLREVKRDLTREKKKLNPKFRRQTTSSFPNLAREEATMPAPLNSTQSTNTDYHTADETMRSEKNDAQAQRNEILLEDTNNGSSPVASSSGGSSFESACVPDEILDKSRDSEADDIILLSSDEDEGLGTFHVKSENASHHSRDISIALERSNRQVSTSEDVDDIVSLISSEDEGYEMRQIDQVDDLNKKETSGNDMQLDIPEIKITFPTPSRLPRNKSTNREDLVSNFSADNLQYHRLIEDEEVVDIDKEIPQCPKSSCSSNSSSKPLSSDSSSNNLVEEIDIHEETPMNFIEKYSYWNKPEEIDTQSFRSKDSSNVVVKEFVIHGMTPLDFLRRYSAQTSKDISYNSSLNKPEEIDGENPQSSRSKRSSNSSSSNYSANDLVEGIEIHEETPPSFMQKCSSKTFEDSSFNPSWDKPEEIEREDPQSSRSGYSSMTNDDDDLLNDTLDDMENLLRGGLDHLSLSDEDIVENTPSRVLSNCSKQFMSHLKKSESKIPKLAFPSSENIPKSPSPESNFRVPQNPPRSSKKSPSVSKTNPVRKISPFKDIVSPVRLYIKNSSRPLLKQNHKPDTSRSRQPLAGISENIISQPRRHRNLVDSFPEVIYKPSEQVLKQFDKHIILPSNIKKLIRECVVIKHEVRRQVNLNESELSIGEKLNNGDLSCIVSDVRNISLHVAKQGLNL